MIPSGTLHTHGSCFSSLQICVSDTHSRTNTHSNTAARAHTHTHTHTTLSLSHTHTKDTHAHKLSKNRLTGIHSHQQSECMGR